MKTFLNILFISIFIQSCNSQTIPEKFISEINSSITLENTNVTKTEGSITITYPNNLKPYFQNVINQFVIEDFKKEVCEGQDGVLVINYNVKYYSNNILSIYKLEYDDYCDYFNNTRYVGINLFRNNNITYSMDFNYDSNELKDIINSSISLMQTDDCIYNFEDSVKGLLIYEPMSTKYFLNMDKICQVELEIKLTKNLLMFQMLN